MSSVKYLKQPSGIVHLVLDKPQSTVNIMDASFRGDWHGAIQRLKDDDAKGVVIRSAKDSFFAGGDLKLLKDLKPEDAKICFDQVEGIKADFRTLETLGLPVVAAINGPALGGGWEIALACHKRVALDHPKVKIGLPEATLGLLPGAGGITRMVRLLGLEAALPYLMEGRKITAQRAHEAGLVDQLVSSVDELVSCAETIILDTQTAAQPWDQDGYRLPGGSPLSPKLAMKLAAAPAALKKKTKGCFPAPEAILAAAVEGAAVDFDTASRIESRYFTKLATGPVAKNMIEAFFFQLEAISSGGARPGKSQPESCKKLGVLGAGMMGAGIAYVCARQGMAVVLKDISKDKAEGGKDYSRRLLERQVAKGRLTEDRAEATLALINTTADYQDLDGCDLIIEAVFENRELKAQVTQEAEAFLRDGGLFASNTSTLPITGLATAARSQENFVGLHFFSPVDKMPLVEIIRGERSSDDSIAKAFDFVRQIKKTPIVVNDSRGFFTSRVFGTFTKEGALLLSEGVDPAIIENTAVSAGMPVGPLAVTDEVSLKLVELVRRQTEADLKAEGRELATDAGDQLLAEMLSTHQRSGKLHGAGFYDYPDSGPKKLWRGLYEHYVKPDHQLPVADIRDRLLFRQAIETVRCLEEGVLNSVREANIGSIFGIGFPPWTGGAIQYINQFGLRDFCLRAQELASRYGDRFEPPSLLISKAEAGQIFTD